ncbi:hypothetical protein AZE42_09339 [Rhizopogon vesiculosus]|uniref:Uncharacterized protein n=1 Tax=Rhizopogon vesiculosus TaxID=180088 RepID=A0A1J8PVW0_9AGAM|nr:hypothetical protein AZE42_09339 [Rhizopogon vesiculosus]
MKETVESHSGYSIDDDIVTVPAYFSDSRRQATKGCRYYRGNERPCIVNKPPAATIATSGSFTNPRALRMSPHGLLWCGDPPTLPLPIFRPTLCGPRRLPLPVLPPPKVKMFTFASPSV